MGNFGSTPWGGVLPPAGSVFVSDIIYAALRAGRMLISPGMKTSPLHNADGVMFLNQIVDQWAARKAFAYSQTFQSYTLTPNHSPHLIGPGLVSPDFAAAVRPIRIEQNGAALVLTTATPSVDRELTVRDADWWNNQRVKTLSTSVPTDLYYEPDFPSGSLFFWPVPNFAYDVRLRLWSVINQFASADDAFVAPPAYTKALTLTLSEELCEAWGKPIPASLPRRAAEARRVVINNNIQSPRIGSADVGASGRSHDGWNYYTGM